jgi:ATP-dependent DNA helicase RecG
MLSGDDLLSLNEGKTVEFKRDLSSPKNLLKTLVAFANTAGGRVIVGVDDKVREPLGVESPLDEEERLTNLIADSIEPRLVPNIEMITIAGKTLLIVEVYLSNARPHYLKAQGAENGVYVRLGSSNRQADRELIADLRRSIEGIAFDELPMPELAESDLDLTVARSYFKGRRELDEQALLTLKLLRPEQGRLVPTKGAMLLFGKDRIFHFPDAWVQCGRFAGVDKAAIFDHIELDQPLPQAVDSILSFLKKHAMRGADFSQAQRRDVWSIPLGILREVVINALVHADYSQRGAPIRVAFFDDRIEVENPGILLPGMTIEDMKQGISKIRNPVIARVFRELNLIEQWGSGVRRIFREAADLGLPTPEIVEIGLRLRFIVPIAGSIAVDGVGLESRLESRLESQLESRLESPLAARVMIHLVQNADGKVGMAQMLGHKTVSGELHKQVKRLVEGGLIEYTIPDKPNSRLQKYRLTAKGQALLEEVGGRHE